MMRWRGTSLRWRPDEEAAGGLSTSQIRSRKRRHTLRCLKAPLAFQLQHGRDMPPAIGSKDLELFRQKLYDPTGTGVYEKMDSPGCFAYGLQQASSESQASHSPCPLGEQRPMGASIPAPWWSSPVENFRSHYLSAETVAAQFSTGQDYQVPQVLPVYLPGAPAAVVTPPAAVHQAEKRAETPTEGLTGYGPNEANTALTVLKAVYKESGKRKAEKCGTESHR